MKLEILVTAAFCVSCSSTPRPDGILAQGDMTYPVNLSWERVEVEPLAGASLRGVSMPTDQTIWISGSGGACALSTDGGESWSDASPAEAREDGLDLRCLWALDDRLAYAASSGPGDASRILRTTDGGATWSTLHVNLDPDGFFDSIAFWDRDRGVVMGDATDGYLTILVTQDGGDTWERVPRDRTPEAIEGEHAFAASNRCIAVVPPNRAWIGTGGSAARVWHTDDSGASWTAVSTPLPQGGEADGVYAIDFVDERHGVVVGGNYTRPEDGARAAAWTEDGGRTWHSADTRGYRSAVDSSAWGWLAVGINGTDYSADGSVWSAQSFAPELNAIAHSPDGYDAWAVGPGGGVHHVGVSLAPGRP